MIRTRELRKHYASAAGEVRALDGVDLDIAAGEFVAVTGRSGSGKSTLLHLLAGLDRPSGGELQVAGEALPAANADALARWRGRMAGVVFQSYQLLPTLTALENVLLPMDLLGTRPAREREPHARALLERVGVLPEAGRLPAALSGGQQQRVAIARALANDPPLLLADEPTGNLDSHTGASVLALFAELARAGRTVVVVTHERTLPPGVDRTLVLADGRLA